MKLIVGLGNPGSAYAKHRHNLGYQALHCLSEQCDIGLKKEENAFVGKGIIENEEVLLVKPTTWMNLSGEAVGAIARYYKIAAGDVVVIHDDIDLNLGTLRWTSSSGHGGHNGVRSIIEHLGTQDFCRLRLGVGRPPQGMNPADYVLQPFAVEEKNAVTDLNVQAVDSIKEFLRHGLQWVCQKYN